MYDSYTGERTEENPHDSYDNQLLCEPVEGGKYRVTIVADEEFLNDPDTVYPAYVDPTITVDTSGSGWTKTIEDAVVFSGQPYSNQNNNKYMHVGYVDTTYGVGRALVKFPGLRDSAAFNSLEDDQITSVKFYIYKTNDVNSTEDTVIHAYRYTGADWTETNATYCSIDPDSYTDLQDYQLVYGTQQKYIGFDITEAAMLWRTNSAAANKGIMLKNIDEYSRNCDRNFLSTRMGTNKPYVQVNYNVIPVSGIQLSSTNLDLLVNDTATLTATVLPSNATYKEVCFVSSDPNVVSVGSYSGMLCAQSTGTATITAWSVYNISKIATCTVSVYNSTDIKYINLTKDNSGEYTLSITKFFNGDFYFQAFSDCETGDLYSLSQENINWLNNTYDSYYLNYISQGHSNTNIIDHRVYPVSYTHLSKGKPTPAGGPESLPPGGKGGPLAVDEGWSPPQICGIHATSSASLGRARLVRANSMGGRL